MKTYQIGNLQIEVQQQNGKDRIAHFSGVPHVATRIVNTGNNAVSYAWVPSILFLEFHPVAV